MDVDDSPNQPNENETGEFDHQADDDRVSGGPPCPSPTNLPSGNQNPSVDQGAFGTGYERYDWAGATMGLIKGTPDYPITRLDREGLDRNMKYGGMAPRTVRDVLLWLLDGRYPERQDTSTVQILVQADIETTSRGFLPCIRQISYPATKCWSYTNMKKQAKEDWKKVHFRNHRLTMPGYDGRAVQVQVRDTYGESSGWYPVSSDIGWSQRYTKNVVHGRNSILQVRLIYVVDHEWERDEWLKDRLTESKLFA